MYIFFNSEIGILNFNSKSAETLMHESGCRMDHPVAAKFRSHVMNGEWGKAHTDLQELKNLLENPESLIVCFLLYYSVSHMANLFCN